MYNCKVYLKRYDGKQIIFTSSFPEKPSVGIYFLEMNGIKTKIEVTKIEKVLECEQSNSSIDKTLSFRYDIYCEDLEELPF